MRRSLFLLCMAAALGLLPFTPLQATDASAQRRRPAASKTRAPRKAPRKVVDTPSPALGLDDSDAPAASAGRTRGPTRIDFDDRLVQGQTNQSGAVYLYDRKALKQRSMVRMRESFREETVATVYDR